jgi:hypothetical protein
VNHITCFHARPIPKVEQFSKWGRGLLHLLLPTCTPSTLWGPCCPRRCSNSNGLFGGFLASKISLCPFQIC